MSYTSTCFSKKTLLFVFPAKPHMKLSRKLQWTRLAGISFSKDGMQAARFQAKTPPPFPANTSAQTTTSAHTKTPASIMIFARTTSSYDVPPSTPSYTSLDVSNTRQFSRQISHCDRHPNRRSGRHTTVRHVRSTVGWTPHERLYSASLSTSTSSFRWTSQWRSRWMPGLTPRSMP